MAFRQTLGRQGGEVGTVLSDSVWLPSPPTTRMHIRMAVDDHTRVKLNRQAGQDYINASYVVSVGGMGIVQLKIDRLDVMHTYMYVHHCTFLLWIVPNSVTSMILKLGYLSHDCTQQSKHSYLVAEAELRSC